MFAQLQMLNPLKVSGPPTDMTSAHVKHIVDKSECICCLQEHKMKVFNSADEADNMYL